MPSLRSLLPYSTAVSPRGELLNMFGALVFAVSAQGTPFYHQVLEARGACIPVSQGSEIIGETVLGRLLPLGHCTDHRLKHPQSLSERGLLAYSGALA